MIHVAQPHISFQLVTFMTDNLVLSDPQFGKCCSRSSRLDMTYHCNWRQVQRQDNRFFAKQWFIWKRDCACDMNIFLTLISGKQVLSTLLSKPVLAKVAVRLKKGVVFHVGSKASLKPLSISLKTIVCFQFKVFRMMWCSTADQKRKPQGRKSFISLKLEAGVIVPLMCLELWLEADTSSVRWLYWFCPTVTCGQTNLKHYKNLFISCKSGVTVHSDSSFSHLLLFEKLHVHYVSPSFHVCVYPL